MINLFILYAFLAGLGTWFITALGSSLVFFIKSENKKILSLVMGLGAGIMIAASFFSLILPSLEQLESSGRSNIEAILGFFFGGIFLFIFDLFLGKIEKKKKISDKSNKLLFLAITLHNIPEGLAIGVAFGLALGSSSETSLINAFLLALGIGLQNFPEGLAISLPLKQNGMSKKKAFMYGQLSAIVEPISAILGVILIYFVEMILPFVLCFASGAMLYVVVEELIPNGKLSKDDKMCTLGIIFGYVIMMFLDLLF
mgnify:CR=1 FL=1